MAITINRGKFDILNRYVTGGEFVLMLVQTAPASTAPSGLNVLGDVTAGEATFTNYARRVLTSVAAAEDDTNNRARMTAANPATYTAAGGTTNNTIVGGYVYRRGTAGADTPTTDPLLAFLDMADITTNGGDLTISFSATGIVTIA